jgi:hypothetical protein
MANVRNGHRPPATGQSHCAFHLVLAAQPVSERTIFHGARPKRQQTVRSGLTYGLGMRDVFGHEGCFRARGMFPGMRDVSEHEGCFRACRPSVNAQKELLPQRASTRASVSMTASPVEPRRACWTPPSPRHNTAERTGNIAHRQSQRCTSLQPQRCTSLQSKTKRQREGNRPGARALNRESQS